MANQIMSRIGQVPRNGGFSMEGYWIWGSAVVKGDDGKYHMYASRWSKKLPFFTSWMTDCEIVHAVADAATGPYEFADVALEKRGAQYWDGQACHNPKIMRHDGKYILYYMGSTHPFEPFPEGRDPNITGKHCITARSHKRVGVAVADNPHGPWQRFDNPILPTKPNTFYSFLTSNPSPIIHPDGSVLLMFKARAYEGNTHGDMTIGLAKAEHYLGPYTVVNSEPIFGPGRLGVIEDPSIWLDQEGYHMLAKDMGDQICGEQHAGILCHSDNGLDWRLDPEPLAYSKHIRWDDGTSGFLGQMERVFPLVENGVVTTLFFAVMDGPGGFGNGRNSWNLALPLP
jgi:hypothetical protein